MSTQQVLCVKDTNLTNITQLLSKYSLTLKVVDQYTNIPGSYWGDSEAGLISNKVYVRDDTPIHSLLHETCHYICMDKLRREQLDTNAEGDYDEENAVCYLQILLANELIEMQSPRMMQDMDSWGYTFRFGSAKKWFENDAEDAKQWLLSFKLIDENKQATFNLRD